MESSSASPSLLRVVLDTNVLVSGLLYGGLPKRVLRLALEGRFVAVTSRALQAELLRILCESSASRRAKQPRRWPRFERALHGPVRGRC